MFKKLTDSLKYKGIFTGQFFGEKDGWSNYKGMTFHTKKEVEELLKSFKVIVFREKKEDRTLASGEVKFWHVFDVIAEKVN